MTADLVAYRQRKRRKLFWRWLAGLALVGFAIWAFLFSDWFKVQSVVVRGCVYADCQLVETSANIEIGSAIALLDSSRITEDLLKIKEVAGVELRRALPHEVILVITERTPVATISDGPGWRLVDSEGVIFANLLNRPADLLQILAANQSARAAAAMVADSLTQWLAAEVKTVRAVSLEDLRLELLDGRVVLFGDSSQSDRKQEVLNALLQIPAKTYDVSAPELPTTRN